MSTATIWETESTSSDATYAIGERFGKACKGGELFILASDLGGGKTTFVKGLASGLGCKETVSSPTFTVSRVYRCRDSLELHHFDFYRLQEPGVVAFELQEVLHEPLAVVAVEWADIVDEVLPSRRILISLSRHSSGEEIRKITFDIPEFMNYIKEALA